MQEKSLLKLIREAPKYYGSLSSVEQENRSLTRNQSIIAAKRFFSKKYGVKIADIIVENIMAKYSTTYRKSADTFKGAWNALGTKVVATVIYRAVNDLPANEKKREK